MIYKGLRLDCGYRVDLMVAHAVVVEIQAVDRLAPVHAAPLLTYLRSGGWKVGLLINFHVPLLRDGIGALRSTPARSTGEARRRRALPSRQARAAVTAPVRIRNRNSEQKY